MITYQFVVTLPQPIATMLELEAQDSNRTSEQQLAHVMVRHYEELIRRCRCGYFIYHQDADLACSDCGKGCTNCLTRAGSELYCASCAKDRSIEHAPSFKDVPPAPPPPPPESDPGA